MSDLIRRDDAIEALAELARKRFTIQDYFQIYLDALKDADIKIRQLPSAQPEPPEECERCMMEHTDEMEKLEAELAMAQPKMGKWIYHIDDLFPAESTMECNKCHAEQPLTCDDEFCPHCGAKMEVTE